MDEALADFLIAVTLALLGPALIVCFEAKRLCELAVSNTSTDRGGK